MGTRKGNNEGSIYKDKQGHWRGQVQIPSSDGKIKRKYFYGKTRKEVSEKVNELISQLNSNSYYEPCNITLFSWLCTWLDTYNENIRMTTKINYETYVYRHICNSIGQYELSKLNPIMIQQFYNEKSKTGKLDGSGGLNPKTLRNMHNMLHKALDQARRLNYIQTNPTNDVILPKHRKNEMRFFNVEDQKKLQEVIKGNRLEMPILLDLYTGLRQGELLGLTWRNVHINSDGKSFIRVTQTLNRMRNPDKTSEKKTIIAVNEPKTINSVRTIPLIPFIAEKMLEYQKQQKEYFDRKRLPYSEFVFTSTAGTPIDPRVFQRDFKKILIKN